VLALPVLAFSDISVSNGARVVAANGDGVGRNAVQLPDRVGPRVACNYWTVKFVVDGVASEASAK
jgi:hypothetical protein